MNSLVICWCRWLFFLFWSGMRHSEAAALRWNDIDSEARHHLGIAKLRLRRGSCAQDCGFGSRDSDAPRGSSISRSDCRDGFIRMVPNSFPESGAEADDGQLVDEARSSSTACRRRIEGHLVQSSSQSWDSA